MMERIGVIETYLSTVIVFFLLWWWRTFLGTWLSIVFGAICTAVLLIALISEWIEPSKVPQRYFQLMGALLLGIATAAGLFWLIDNPV